MVLRAAVAALAAAAIGLLLFTSALPCLLVPPGLRFGFTSLLAGGELTRRPFGGSAQRACRATQRTLSGVLEMYNLDTNGTRLPGLLSGPFEARAQAKGAQRGLSGKLLTARCIGVLRAEGYLQAEPVDPGYGEQSYSHYVVLDDQLRVGCLIHGCSPSNRTAAADDTPREQLLAAGFRDQELLDQAAVERERSTGVPLEVRVSIELLLAVTWLLGGALAAAGRTGQLSLFPSRAVRTCLVLAVLELVFEGRPVCTGPLLGFLDAAATLFLLSRMARFPGGRGPRPVFVNLTLRRDGRQGLSRVCPDELSGDPAGFATLEGCLRGRTSQSSVLCGAGLSAAGLAALSGLSPHAFVGALGAALLGFHWGTKQAWLQLQRLEALDREPRLFRLLSQLPGIGLAAAVFGAGRPESGQLTLWLGTCLLASNLVQAAYDGWLLAAVQAVVARPPVARPSQLRRATRDCRPAASTGPAFDAAALQSLALSSHAPPEVLVLAPAAVKLAADACCRVCGEGLSEETHSRQARDVIVFCDRCETPHHLSCWQYNRGCAVYACEGEHSHRTSRPGN